MTNAGIFLAGILSLIIGLAVLVLGSTSKGGFQHGDTKIWGEAWFVLIIFGVLLIAIASGLP